MDRDFKGIWIPSELWLNSDLKVMEKIFLVEIASLDGVDGCYASNSYFSEFFDLSKTRCSAIIKSLKEKGYITIRRFYENANKSLERRVINVNKNTIESNCNRIIGKGVKDAKPKESEENTEGEVSKNIIVNEEVVDNKDVIVNKSAMVSKDVIANEEVEKENGQAISNIQNRKESEKPIYVDIITYLNDVCGTRYRHTTPKNQRLINARVKEGYNLDDFKKVVDKKQDEWFGTNMEKYLRPETLFGTKFERYINEIQMELSKGGRGNDWKSRNIKNNRENKKCRENERASRYSKGENTNNRSLTDEEREWAKRELF